MQSGVCVAMVTCPVRDFKGLEMNNAEVVHCTVHPYIDNGIDGPLRVVTNTITHDIMHEANSPQPYYITVKNSCTY